MSNDEASGEPARETEPPSPGYRWTGLVLVLVVAFVAAFARIGADCDWLVALGDRIRADGKVPTGVPFASAPSAHWHNVLVLAELVLSVVHGWGRFALVVLDLVAVIVSLVILDRDARRRGAGDGGLALALLFVSLGTLGSLVIVRVSLFSLVAFAAVIALVRAQERRPSRAVWWLPVIVALWSNLHGAVLVGVAVIGVYLVISRLRGRPLETIAVGIATLVAVLVTPAGPATADYYWTVLHNRAAARGLGLWSQLSLARPLDVVFIVVAVLLLVAIVLGSRRGGRRLAAWEWIVLAALVVASVQSARNGMLLLFFIAGPAAVALTRVGRGASVARGPDARSRRLAVIVTVVCAVVAAVVLTLRHSAVEDPVPAVVDRLTAATTGRVVLAPSPLAEELAVHGSRLWLANPIDAFSAADQDRYLDFVSLGRIDGSLLDRGIGAVLVTRGSPQEKAIRAVPSFEYAGHAGTWMIFLRR